MAVRISPKPKIFVISDSIELLNMFLEFTPTFRCLIALMLSTSGTTAYTTGKLPDEQLFRNTPPSDIKITFQKILNGSPMPLSWGSHYNYLPFAPPQIKDVFGRKGRYPHVLHPPPSRGAQSSPRILCVDDQTVAQYNLPDIIKEACQRLASPEAEPPDTLYLQGTPYIVVCESFWDLQVLPPSTRQARKSKVCPAWDPKTRMPDHRGPSIDDCFAHQALDFIHEGVHFYIQNSLTDWTLPREAYEWPDILSRQASYLRRNPSNYQVYAGSKF